MDEADQSGVQDSQRWRRLRGYSGADSYCGALIFKNVSSL